MTRSNNIWKIMLVIILIGLFSWSLRLDLDNNLPKGADTYELYSLSKNIQENGYIIWNIDLFTAIGLTSVSYPSGGLVFLSEVSSISNLNITNIIIIWNFIFIITCALLIFLISKQIFKNDQISLLATIIYLNTRFFIAYSTFFTARNFIQLFFLAILLLILKKYNLKNWALTIILITLSFFIHRATILTIIFLIAFVVSKRVYKSYKNKPLHNLFLILLSIAIFLISVYIFGHASVGTETSIIQFDTGINYLNDLLSVIFSLSMHFGLLLIFTICGYFFLIIKKQKNQEDIFIIMSTVIASGFLVETVYFFYMFLPILVILTTYFLDKIISLNKKSWNNIIVIMIIIASIIPLAITIRESKSDLIYVKDQTVNTISYLENENIPKSIICNNHEIYCGQIYALGHNITALTYTSTRTMLDKIVVEKTGISWDQIRGKIMVKDNILGVSLFSDTYTSAIIKWNTPQYQMKELIKFTNLGYIIDSTNSDSAANRINMEKKFRNTNRVYDNGLQQVKVIK